MIVLDFLNWFTGLDYKWFFGLIIPGVATLFGAYWGANKAGQKSVEAVKQQIIYDREKSEKYRVERYLKLVPILRRQIDSLFNYFRQLEFLIRENETGLNVYEIDFSEEITNEFGKILIVKDAIEKFDIDYISIEINENLQRVLFIITELDTYLDTYLKQIDEDNKDYRLNNIYTKIKKLNELFTKIQKDIDLSTKI